MNFNFDLAKKATFVVANVLTGIYTSMQIGAFIEKRAKEKERRKVQAKEGV